MTALQTEVDRIASQLLPGWRVEVVERSREQIDKLIPGSLAVCDPLPERSMATVYVLQPWPARESLAETLWHELTHAALSPITRQLGEHPGAIMLEEQIVERIGTLLSRVPSRARRGIAAALVRAPAALRARLSQVRARHSGAPGEEKMLNPEMVKTALDAIESGDAAGAIEILKGLIASAAGGAEPEGSDMEPASERSEALAAKKMGEPEPGMKAEPEPGMKGDPGMYGRRARAMHEELAAITRDAREQGKARLVDSLRARLGDSRGVAAVEKRILAATDYASAKAVHDLALELAPAAAATAPTEGLRARSDARQTAAPTAPAPEPADLGEFDGSFVAEYRRLARTDAAAADYWLRAGRARLARDTNRKGN